MATWTEEDDDFVATVSTPKVDPLNSGTDYEKWVDKMRIALCWYGLYRVVTGEITEPTPPPSITLLSPTESTSDDDGGSSKALTITSARFASFNHSEAGEQFASYEQNLKKFRRQDEKAWALIFMNLSEALRVEIRGTKNAHAAWKKLEETFGGRSQQKVQNAWANLIHLNHNRYKSISEYCGVHCGYMNSLEKALEQKLPKTIWACSLIDGLKGSYANYLEPLQYSARKNGQFIDYDELIRCLHHIEHYKAMESERVAGKRGGNFAKQARSGSRN